MHSLPGLTSSLGRFAAEFTGIPDPALSVAATGVSDAIGVLLAGRADAAVQALRAVLLEGTRLVEGGAASVLLGPEQAQARDAAFINATAAHALAMDDVAAGCHPSALLMPALLAAGEAQGSSGLQLLQAYVIGYEILSELASREADPLHGTGWHPSAVLGPAAVAGAVARLFGLSAIKCTHAIGLAASMSGGLVANFGTPTKAIQVGRAASAGVLAAQLARRGVTASSDALERSPGLLAALSPNGRVRLDGGFDPDFGELRILSAGLCIKKYPVCYSTHRVVDAAAALAQAPGFNPSAVAQVSVHIGETQAWMARHHTVRTPFEARYSVEFAVASGLVARDAGFAQLTPEFIDSPTVQRLIDKTQLVLRHDRSQDDPVFCTSDRVVLLMHDGSTLDSGEVGHASGHALRPLSEDARRRKFMQCAGSGGLAGSAQALYDALLGLACLPDVRMLARLATGSGVGCSS